MNILQSEQPEIRVAIIDETAIDELAQGSIKRVGGQTQDVADRARSVKTAPLPVGGQGQKEVGGHRFEAQSLQISVEEELPIDDAVGCCVSHGGQNTDLVAPSHLVLYITAEISIEPIGNKGEKVVISSCISRRFFRHLRRYPGCPASQSLVFS